MIQWVYNGYNRDCLQCMADPSQGVVETHFPWGNRVLALVLAKAIHANQDKSNAVLVSKHIKTYQNCSACNSFDPLEVKLEHINLWTSTSPEGRIPFSPVCECVCQMYTMCVCVRHNIRSHLEHSCRSSPWHPKNGCKHLGNSWKYIELNESTAMLRLFQEMWVVS